MNWESQLESKLDAFGESYPEDVIGCTADREALREEWRSGTNSAQRAPNFQLWTEDRIYVTVTGWAEEATLHSYPRDPAHNEKWHDE